MGYWYGAKSTLTIDYFLVDLKNIPFNVSFCIDNAIFVGKAEEQVKSSLLKCEPLILWNL